MHPNRLFTTVALAASLLGCGGDGGSSTVPRPVASVEVTGAPTEPMLVGSTVQLAATALDAAGNALSKTVTWSSSDEAIARVSSSGLVTSLAAGRVTIKARSETKEASTSLDFREGATLGANGGVLVLLGGAVTINVPQGALAQSALLLVGTATGTPEDVHLVPGSAYELAPVNISFAKPALLTLRYDPARLPSTSAEGSLLLGTLSASGWTPVPGSTVNVSAKTVSGVITHGGPYAVLTSGVDHVVLSGAPASGELYVGQTAQLAATPYDESNSALVGRVVSWSTSDPNVIAVTGAGRVSALATGSAIITARIEGKSATVTLVVKPVPVASVSITSATTAAYVGQYVQLTATTKDSDGGVLAGRVVTWKSSDIGRATVDANGKVTTTGEGSVAITATSEGQSASVTLTVLPRVVADWSAAAEWVTYQGNALHNGYVDATVDPTAFAELWTKKVFADGLLNPVAAGDGNVFISTKPHSGSPLFTVLDARTGVEKWTYDFGAIESVNPPAYGNGAAYVQTGAQQASFLWGFESSTGVIRFRTPYGNQFSLWYAPVVVGSTVYAAGGYYGGMFAVDATTGTQKWTAALNQYDQFTPAVRDELVYTYIGGFPAKVTASNAATGAVVYEIPDPGFSGFGYSMNAAPALGEDNDLLVTQDGRLMVFDLAGRQIKYERSGGYVGSVTIAGGTLYVSNGSQIEARRESDGSLQWTWVPPQGQPRSATIVTNNLLFVSTASTTYAIDLSTHQPIWSYPAGGLLALSNQGILFIAQDDGKLSAITLK